MVAGAIRRPLVPKSLLAIIGQKLRVMRGIPMIVKKHPVRWKKFVVQPLPSR
ncbi:hypothetical protein D3C86_2207900 [compost metagenome]